jgi:hypothetical protein
MERGEASYKYPRLKIQTRETFVRRLICSGKMTGMGSEAKRKSVKMLIAFYGLFLKCTKTEFMTYSH